MLGGTDQTEASLSKATNQPRPSLFLLPASLLVMLNLPLMFTHATGPDQYSFGTITAWQGTRLPLLLSFITNCFLALLAFGGHLILWQWQYQGSGGHSRPFKRAALVVGIPLLLAFTPSTLLTVNGGQAFPVAVGFLLFASMTVTVALRDPEAKLSPQDAVTWLWGAIVTIVVLLVMAIAVMFLQYTAETLLPTGNLFWTAELDWTRMGFGPEEFVHRHLGVMVLFTILASAYMIFIVGGAMVGEIWARAWPRSAAAATAEGYPPESDPPATVLVTAPINTDALEQEEGQASHPDLTTPEQDDPSEPLDREPEAALEQSVPVETPEQDEVLDNGRGIPSIFTLPPPTAPGGEGEQVTEDDTKGEGRPEDEVEGARPPTLQELWEAIGHYDSGPMAPYEAILNGQHVGVSQEFYKRIEQRTDLLIRATDLYVNMVLEEVYLHGEPLTFYGDSQPYYLTCAYAEQLPGVPCSTRALRRMIVEYMGSDQGNGLNVAGIITRLIESTFRNNPIVTRASLKRGHSKVIEGRNVFLIRSRNFR